MRGWAFRIIAIGAALVTAGAAFGQPWGRGRGPDARNHVQAAGEVVIVFGGGRGAPRGHYPPQGYYEPRGGGIPAFCRSGAGHPVFGPAWCYERGFAPGGYTAGYPVYYEEYEDVVFHEPYPARGPFGGGVLIDVVGQVVFQRLERQRHELGLRGPVQGRWLRGNGRILRVDAGREMLAEFVDENGDGRVEFTRVHRGRRGR